jgi:hypothetical protein
MLGEAFATEVERAIDDIPKTPDRFPIWLHDAAAAACSGGFLSPSST